MKPEETYEFLLKNGYIEYGKVVPESVFSIALGANPTDPMWVWRYLSFCEYLEDQGHFCSTRGLEKGWCKILEFSEMSHKVENFLKTFRRKQKRAINTMALAKCGATSERESVTHAHALHKLTLLLQASSSVLA